MAVAMLPGRSPNGSASFHDMEPLVAPVSVVIPCFRCAGTIRRAVHSAATQSLRPREIILVDDASGDDTKEALESVRAEFGTEWVRIVSLASNVGAAGARNAGWDEARGEYVALLDADDSWLPNKIARQYAFMRSHPVYQVSGHRAHYGDQAPEGLARTRSKHSEIGRARVLLKNPMVTPSFMFRRNLPLRFHIGSRYMEDQRFLLDAVYSGIRVAKIEETLAVIHKPAYGTSGLSAALWAMEQGELANYKALRDAGHLGRIPHALLATYSLAKYCRRLVLARFRR